MVAALAIDRAMLAGFVVYLVVDLLNQRRPNLYLAGSAILLPLGAALQLL